MKKLLALLFLLLAAVPAAAQTQGPEAILCNKVAVTGTMTVGTVQAVAGVANQAIHVCGYVWEGLAAGTVQFVFGTGASCTSSTPITTNFTVAANQAVVDHAPNVWTSSVDGQTLCAVVTGTNSVAATIYYTQF